jgi:hypothetical protein
MITREAFCEKHNISLALVGVHKSIGNYPVNVITSEFIDDKYFERRVAFRNYVKEFNQAMYYYLTEFFSESECGRVIEKHFGGNASSYSVFMNHRLFCLEDSRSIMDYKVSMTEWKLFRFNRKVMIRLNQIFGIKFDVEYILDRRAEND